ncbi:MAG TPA: S53 family peptidase, partial [Solirubrobacterales bacterium]|nr:S53 family peptidase [Solirubrobacterales bacterium]
SRGLCLPGKLRRPVRQISAGERYQLGSTASVPDPAARRAKITNDGTPEGCSKAVATGAYTPNQLATAYEVDPLHASGLEGRGIRVATLAGQRLQKSSIRTWAQCFGMPEPSLELIRMPSSVPSTQNTSDEEYLDVEALATLAPRLQRITPISVPLDTNFSHSFPLFMFGVLDRSRQNGKLPHVLSISDGVCESRFTDDQLTLSQRLLREASVLGITALAASGDLGFLGCQVPKEIAGYPDSSRFVAGVGGTALSVTADNEIADEVVWSTFGDPGEDGVGSGGGPSGVWARPGFQRAPGVGPDLQSGQPTRLTPDLAANAAFAPGLAIFDATMQGWGADGGTSAATPLAAAIVALTLEQERAAGRPQLGSLPPLLYAIGRGDDYASVFFDVTEGTSSPKPNTPLGQSPAGGAAQPGYDLATGLGTLRAKGFADAVASTPPGG